MTTDDYFDRFERGEIIIWTTDDRKRFTVQRVGEDKLVDEEPDNEAILRLLQGLLLERVLPGSGWRVLSPAGARAAREQFRKNRAAA